MTEAPVKEPDADAEVSRSLFERLRGFDGLDAVIAILLWKLGTFATAYVAWALLPFNQQLYEANYRYGDRVPTSLAASFNTWDSQHYILLAEQGYQKGLLSNAFGPLYPLMIRFANLVTGDSIVSGLLIANVASAVALYLLYRLVANRWRREAGFATLLLCMAFPTAFFLNLIYTEALFLLLSVIVFYALYDRRFWLAALAGFLLPFLRVPGIVVVVPMAWVIGRESLRLSFEGVRPRFEGFRWRPDLLYVLAPIAGFVCYLVYMHFAIGDAFIAMHTEKLYISNRSIENLLRPDKLIGDLFLAHYSVHGYLDSAIDRIFFAVFVLSLPLVYVRVDKPMFLFCAIVGMQPFLGSFMSYTRLVMVAFPLYIAYGVTFARSCPQLTHAVIYPLLLLQAVLLALQINGNWVA
jgi:hypothetical protein